MGLRLGARRGSLQPEGQESSFSGALLLQRLPSFPGRVLVPDCDSVNWKPSSGLGGGHCSTLMVLQVS